MIRKIIFTGICALALLAAQADVAAAQSIGFKLGMTSSKMDADPDGDFADQDRLSAFGGGGFIRFGFSGLALQLEALALTKGAKFEENGETAKLKLDYIEVPLTAMFTLGNGPYIFGGPAVAFEINCKLDVEVGNIDASEDCDEGEDPGDRKKTDIGATVGGGLQFSMGPGAILVEARHTWGLTNLNDSPTDDFKIRNRSIAVFVGYSIPIGRR